MRQYLDIEHYKQFRVGSPALNLDSYRIEELIKKAKAERSFKFRIFKKTFDYGCAVMALPIIGVLMLVLSILNPFLNPGPLFFRQKRTGQYGRPFLMWKFRSMTVSKHEVRDPRAALEKNRITKLGYFIRRARIDELPNFFNVLRGEMSVVGPRPEAASHAEYYDKRIFGFAQRHRVKPGLTGLAQVEQGYVEDQDAAMVKIMYDNLYVERMCGRLDVYIIFRTFRVIVTGFGAK